MADILIRGMNMPKNCLDCKIRGDRLTCPILDRYAMNNKTDRHPDCPIFPFPEVYGRLIDADALIRDKSGEVTLWCGYEYQDHFVVFEEDIKNAPTIIPAEGENANDNP